MGNFMAARSNAQKTLEELEARHRQEETSEEIIEIVRSTPEPGERVEDRL
ncbi:hypothetical protein [Methylosinus sporium]